MGNLKIAVWGFLVSLGTEWAIKNRKADFIYNMLKKRDYPGFLYMLDNGATTTWEHWNGERSHIHNCYNSLGVWFYQALAGIQPDESGAGYARVDIAPQPVDGIEWVRASKDTPFGPLSVSWEKTDGVFSVDVGITVGCTPTVTLPFEPAELRIDGRKVSPEAQFILSAGRHTVVCRP